MKKSRPDFYMPLTFFNNWMCNRKLFHNMVSEKEDHQLKALDMNSHRQKFWQLQSICHKTDAMA